MSKLFYSGNVSDVSGYRTMFVDTRNPNPPAAIATFVTDTTSGGDNIEMTATAGGTATNFITKPFAADRAIDSVMFVNGSIPVFSYCTVMGMSAPNDTG